MVSVLNSLTGPGTKDKSFNLAAMQLSHLNNGNVLNVVFALRTSSSYILSL